jgi:hypothetical protein
VILQDRETVCVGLDEPAGDQDDIVHSVRVAVPPGSRPTHIPGGELTWDGTLDVAEGDAEITIDIP